MKMTGKKIIETAYKYIGCIGKKFCYDYGMAFGNHWCCAFVWDIFRMAKASILFYAGQKTAYVPTAQMWLAANCEHVSMKEARAGDIVVFTWSGNGYNQERGSRDHIGFIRKAGTSSVAYTLEGNTGGTSPMNSKVMERERSVQFIYGIYRPKYEVKKAAKQHPKKGGSQASATPAKKVVKKQDKPVRISAKYRIVSKIGMNVRKSYDKNSRRVGGIRYGKTVHATKKYGDWIYIKYGKIRGWIKTRSGSNVYMKKL